MASKRRVDLRGILADPDLRRELMVPTLQATQAREGVETTHEQAERAYYVVTEGEQATFFDLERFRGGKRSESDRREEMFVRAVRNHTKQMRFDVARRDFSTIEGSPLAYQRVGLVSHIFRDAPSLDPGYATAVVGLQTSDDSQFVRHWWEIPHNEIGQEKPWVPFAKGGEFCRFYADVYLVVLWQNNGHAIRNSKGAYIRNEQHYFKPGLTWPLAASVFNVRWMPEGCIFGHKGPAIFSDTAENSAYLSGILNSKPAEYLLLGLTSRQAMGGRWEVGVVKRLPVPHASKEQHVHISYIAEAVQDAKALWDGGNEICTRFRVPWVLLNDLIDMASSVSPRLDCLADYEATEEARIQQLYAELNDEVYKLYGIPDATRAIIEETLGKRPPEVLWPQMEGKSAQQKRMEHVFRLLSYVVKRVVEADEDGVVPFTSVADEPSLLERVHNELATLFPGHDVTQIEVEITNELKKNVKGYRKTNSIREWLENAFFEYHVSLYKNRPIVWHLASNQGTAPFAFGALVHYHKFDKNRLAKLRAQYLRDAIEHFRREAGLADKAGRSEERLDWQAKVEESQELDRKLQAIQEGRHEGPEGGVHDFRILTPWKSPDERPQGWDPDLDDGVKVNIEPLQKAGVLRAAKVV